MRARLAETRGLKTVSIAAVKHIFAVRHHPHFIGYYAICDAEFLLPAASFDTRVRRGVDVVLRHDSLVNTHAVDKRDRDGFKFKSVQLH